MLKQFLKFFRSSDDPAASVEHAHIQAMQDPRNAEKSYLEFLLESVRPRVEERLKAHPQNDPVLEVATSILLELFTDYWEEPEGALRDERSPQLAPPPPPPSLEISAAEIEEDGERQEDGESEEGGETLEADEFDEVVEEQDGQGNPPAGFINALDDTAEFEPPPIARNKDRESPWPMRLDDAAALRGARVLLAVLLDNDRLPQAHQLEVAEVLMAANLWIRLVAQDTELQEAVQALARLVEQKFAAGQFSQARLLLQIFPANSETRINNDRQLFYEEMILRMGIHRREALGAEAARETGEAMDGMSLDDDEAIRQGLEVLHSKAQARMLLYTRESAEVERWREIAGRSELPGVEEYFLAMIPPRRWRAPVDSGRPVRAILREHIVQPMLRDHVIDHLKACYFVLRAVGDTGLEPYLDTFFEWSNSFCGVDAVAFLPEIYNRTLGGAELIGAVFADIYNRHYQAPLATALSALDEEALSQAFDRAIDAIAQSNFELLAPGQFDLGGFVLDAYLDFEYSEPEFAFKLHRLT